MEDIITILIFLAIAGAAVFRKIKSKQGVDKEATPPKPGGLVSKINAFLTEIQEKIEQEKIKQQRTAEGPTTAAEWQQLMDEGTEGTLGARDLRNHSDLSDHSDPSDLRDLSDLNDLNDLNDPESLDDLILEDGGPPPPPAQIEGAAGGQPRRARRQGRTATPALAGMTSLSQKGAPSMMPRGTMELRRAVVWAEIIGPPIALRNSPDPH